MAYHNATRTIIFKGADESNGEEEVAWLVFVFLTCYLLGLMHPHGYSYRLDWTSVNHLGLATIGDMEIPMSELVRKGTTSRLVGITANGSLVETSHRIAFGVLLFPWMAGLLNGDGMICLTACIKCVKSSIACKLRLLSLLGSYIALMEYKWQLLSCMTCLYLQA